MSVSELETALQAPTEGAGAPDLAGIRRAGARRRRLRTAGGALTGLAVVGLVAGGTVLVSGGLGDDVAVEPAAPPVSRTELSPLAERVLRRVPGAEQINAWQVAIPEPAGASKESWDHDQLTDQWITGEPVPLASEWYLGVTAYEPGVFPDWLYQGVQRVERSMGDETGHPVGSTDTGIVVDGGSLELVCHTAWDWNAQQPLEGEPCGPAVVGVDADGERSYLWGMGTDDFLEPGAGMELFDVGHVDPDDAGVEWIGGLDGTAVDRVVLRDADGTTVEATVAAGTFVPEETIFWGQVPGDLAVVTALDASGEVVERHELQPCHDPVDCEVR
jgi:hypothetical protein